VGASHFRPAANPCSTSWSNGPSRKACYDLDTARTIRDRPGAPGRRLRLESVRCSRLPLSIGIALAVPRRGRSDAILHTQQWLSSPSTSSLSSTQPSYQRARPGAPRGRHALRLQGHGDRLRLPGEQDPDRVGREERAKAALQVLREKGARRQLSPKLFKSGDPKTVGKGSSIEIR